MQVTRQELEAVETLLKQKQIDKAHLMLWRLIHKASPAPDPVDVVPVHDYPFPWPRIRPGKVQ